MSERKKVTLSPQEDCSSALTRFFALFSICFPHYLGAWNRLGLQLLRAFCERKIGPSSHLPIVLYCYSIEDLCEFSYTILRQICRFYEATIVSIDSADTVMKILMIWYCLDGKIDEEQLPKFTDRRPTDFLGNCSSNLPFGPTYHQRLISRLGFWNLSCINLWLWWFCIQFSVVIEIYRGFSVLGNF